MDLANGSDAPTVDLEQVARSAQKCIQSHPVVILGSGASLPHQIRGMGALAEDLCNGIVADETEDDAWSAVRAAIESGDGLEEALQKTAAPNSLVQKIVNLTWSNIASDDLSVLTRATIGAERFPLSDMYRGLFRSANRTIDVVTPNYDRIAEYAADTANFIHSTGFVPGIIRQREGADAVCVYRGNDVARTVRIWKVHGSLDWFINEASMVVSLPLTASLPDGHLPSIVTPGVSKYERTHDEPFRSTIQGADAALGAASAFLCIGYGFRDTHIEPKLVERCRQRSVPIVILARTLTDDARRFLARNAGSSYLALEKHDSGTRAFCAEAPEGVVLQGIDIWSFPSFNNLVF